MGIGESISRGFKFSLGALEDGIGVMGKEPKRLAIYCGAFLAAYVLGVVALILLEAGLGLALDPLIGAGTTGIVKTAVSVLGYVVIEVLSLTPFLAMVEFIYREKKVGIFERRNIIASAKYVAFLIALYVVLGGPLLGLIYLTAGSSLGGIVLLLAIIVAVPLAFLLALAMFYMYPEIAVARKGPIEAALSSWRLVKGNFWETIIFALLMLGIFIILGIILYVIVLVLMMAFMAIGVAVVAASGNALAMLAVMALMYILILVLAVPLMVAAYAFHTKFYKRIVERKAAAVQ